MPYMNMKRRKLDYTVYFNLSNAATISVTLTAPEELMYGSIQLPMVTFCFESTRKC